MRMVSFAIAAVILRVRTAEVTCLLRVYRLAVWSAQGTGRHWSFHGVREFVAVLFGKAEIQRIYNA